MKNKEITVLEQEIHISKDDYFSLTDIARYKNPEDPADVVKNWLRRKDTIEFIGLWEKLNNPNFNVVEFDRFKNEAGHNYFIKEFQRLKADEQKQLGWTVKRELAKINYRIHTDAIKDNIIIPLEISREQASFIYANEADVLNVALFGMTAREWREKNPDKKGNIRDYAEVSQLVCLSNLENLNAYLIERGLSQRERLVELNRAAIRQMKVLAQETLSLTGGTDEQ